MMEFGVQHVKCDSLTQTSKQKSAKLKKPSVPHKKPPVQQKNRHFDTLVSSTQQKRQFNTKNKAFFVKMTHFCRTDGY